MYKKLLSTLILAMQLNTLASSLQASYLPSNLSSSYLPACIQEKPFIGGLVTTLIATNGYLLYRSFKTKQEHKREIKNLNETLNKTEQAHERKINNLATEHEQEINNLVKEILVQLPKLTKTVLYSAVEVTNPQAETYQKKQSIIRALKAAQIQTKTEKNDLLERLFTELISYEQDPAHKKETEGNLARAADIRNSAGL